MPNVQYRSHGQQRDDPPLLDVHLFVFQQVNVALVFGPDVDERAARDVASVRWKVIGVADDGGGHGQFVKYIPDTMMVAAVEPIVGM